MASSERKPEKHPFARQLNSEQCDGSYVSSAAWAINIGDRICLPRWRKVAAEYHLETRDAYPGSLAASAALYGASSDVLTVGLCKVETERGTQTICVSVAIGPWGSGGASDAVLRLPPPPKKHSTTAIPRRGVSLSSGPHAFGSGVAPITGCRCPVCCLSYTGPGQLAATFLQARRPNNEAFMER